MPTERQLDINPESELEFNSNQTPPTMLQQETIDRIKKDAEIYATIAGHIPASATITIQDVQLWSQLDYEAGATTEAEKATALVDALELIKNAPSPYNSNEMFAWIQTTLKTCDEARASYTRGKENGE